MNYCYKSKENQIERECSFEDIVNLYEKRVYGFIYHMVPDKNIVEDLTQEVFIRVYEKFYKYDPEYAVESWLFKITYNITLNYLKKNKNRNKEVSIEVHKDIDINVSDSIQEFETKYIILRELEAFKPEIRAIFLLKIMEDLSFEQIALMFGTSTAAVKLKFYRNRKVLVERLNKSFKEV